MATSASEAVAKDRYYDNPYQDFVADVPNDYIVEKNNLYKVGEFFCL